MRAISSAVLLALACVLLMAGCAGSTSEERCAHTDWYRQGYTDGLTTWYSRIDEHTARCAAAGVTPDAARYRVGWNDGRFDFEHKSSSPN
jgi:hypothetical protein